MCGATDVRSLRETWAGALRPDAGPSPWRKVALVAAIVLAAAGAVAAAVIQCG